MKKYKSNERHGLARPRKVWVLLQARKPNTGSKEE